MSVRSEQPIEYAMTHRVGAGGRAEAFARPESVRAIAQRVLGWRSAAETCRSCSAATAVALRSGQPLCGRCGGQRDDQLTRDPRIAKLRSIAARLATETRRGVTRAATTTPGLTGTAVVFDRRSLNLGDWVEVIRPSAGDRLVAERPDVRCLWNHDSGVVLGRSTSGSLRHSVDVRGIHVEIDPPSWARGHVESVARRDVSGMSFGFVALSDDWHLESGVAIREVLDMHIVEFSPVGFPAYPQTSLTTTTSDRAIRARQTSERLRLAR